MIPSPPAFETAAANSPPVTNPIGAQRIGCLMPKRSVRRVLISASPDWSAIFPVDFAMDGSIPAETVAPHERCAVKRKMILDEWPATRKFPHRAPTIWEHGLQNCRITPDR